MHRINKFKRVLLGLIISILLKNAAFGDSVTPDLKFGLNGRTHPVGAQIASTGGFGVPLWGDPSTWKYGYIRAAANLATSVVVNRAGIEMQVYPISILGFSAGYDSGVRNFVPKYLDCSIFQCNGRVDRKYLKGTVILASHGVIFSMLTRFEELRAFGATKDFFDEMSLLHGKSTGERVLTYNPALLYTLNEAYKVGFTSLYSRALDSGGYSHLYGPIVTWSDCKNWNVIGGVGLNESVLVQSGIAAFFSIQYTILPSISIQDMAIRVRN